MDRRIGFGEPTIIRVRYSEVDRMQLVYHVNYFEYFEWVRSDWVRNFWKPYREIEDAGDALVVVEANLRFRKPAHYDDLLNAFARPLDWGRSRLEFEYKIVRSSDNVLICDGWTAHCFVNRNGQPIPLPTDLRKILETLERE